MDTERLYFSDAYLTRFSARVIARAERGGRPAVALDQSAFYPEGGGQPADAGTLGGVAVLDVQADDGLVWHTLAAPLDADVVQGQVDWARRFDHMQQHHGQHLLSAAFEQLFGLKTVSFHLGAAAATIDLAATALAAEQAAAAEDLTNQVIWEDRPVLARFVTPEELARLPLRKPPQVRGAVRVVSVPDFDHSACGGTHPRATGGVGLAHLRRWERRGEVVQKVRARTRGTVLRSLAILLFPMASCCARLHSHTLFFPLAFRLLMFVFGADPLLLEWIYSISVGRMRRSPSIRMCIRTRSYVHALAPTPQITNTAKIKKMSKKQLRQLAKR